jgi:hypothetical protein
LPIGVVTGGTSLRAPPLPRAPFLERAFDGVEQLGERERLLHVVEGTEPRRLDCGVHSAVARHHHDGEAQQVGIAPLAQEADAVGIRHPDVEQDEIGLRGETRGARSRSIGRHVHVVAFFAQDLLEQVPDVCLVVDDEYLRCAHTFSFFDSGRARRTQRARWAAGVHGQQHAHLRTAVRTVLGPRCVRRALPRSSSRWRGRVLYPSAWSSRRARRPARAC